MELSNTFTVDRPIDVAWPVMCDIERIAPCMPGARLTEVHGDTYSGEVKLKVGPISARFKGTAEMVERDDDAHRAVLKARGKDTGGKGNADATITATAEAQGDATSFTITTDLSITGKVAQFGRSALSDVSTKLLGQFVECLESKVLAGDAVAAAAPDVAGTTDAAGGADPPGPSAGGAEGTTGSAATSGSSGPAGSVGSAGSVAGEQDRGPRRIDGPEAEPVDLVDVAGGAVAKRAAPVAAVMAVFFVLWWWRRRR